MNSDPGSLVSCDWLASNLGEPDIIVLDASKHLPKSGRDAKQEFEAAHIPGAGFLDLDSLTDRMSPVPAALPNFEQLAKRLRRLGVSEKSHIVLYDDSDIKSSARAWFALRANGLSNTAILDGGLAQWRSEGRALESGPAISHKSEELSTDASNANALTQVAAKSDILANLTSKTAQLVDARTADRVFGAGVDPVHGGQNGRIPGAFNVPYQHVLNANGTFKQPAALKNIFTKAGIDWNQPIITTCGSGVTASVLLFALHLAGKDDVQLYDGSWQEWESDPGTPKAQGPEGNTPE